MTNDRTFDLVIASHGSLAAALLETATMICGPIGGARALELTPDDSPESFGERLADALAPSRPTLIFTDLDGGTPSNVARALSATRPGVRCLAGANLAMVIEAATSRASLDDALVERVTAAGRRAIGERVPGGTATG